MPRAEPTPYAFVYQDAASLPEELEEWFAYSVEERAKILWAQSSFAAEWGAYNDWAFTGDEEGSLDWNLTPPEKRKDFMRMLLKGLEEQDLEKRLRHLEVLVYLILGCWHETAGLQATAQSYGTSSIFSDKNKDKGKGKERAVDRPESGFAEPAAISPEVQREKAIRSMYSRSGFQLEWIKTNVLMLFEIKGLQPVFDAVRNACLREW
jgi:hypothetical protein